jgi:predicted DNA-binding protein
VPLMSFPPASRLETTYDDSGFVDGPAFSVAPAVRIWPCPWCPELVLCATVLAIPSAQQPLFRFDEYLGLGDTVLHTLPFEMGVSQCLTSELWIMAKASTITFRISGALKEQLQQLAIEDRRTLSGYLEVIVERHVSESLAKEDYRASDRLAVYKGQNLRHTPKSSRKKRKVS